MVFALFLLTIITNFLLFFARVRLLVKKAIKNYLLIAFLLLLHKVYQIEQSSPPVRKTVLDWVYIRLDFDQH